MWYIFFISFYHLQSNEHTNTLKSALIDFTIGATSGAAGMIVYTPFHYFQNRSIQKQPIIWENPPCWFRGMPSLALGKAPTIAVQMSTYELITKIIKKNNTELSDTQKIAAATIAGAMSGIVNNFSHLIALHQENTGKSFVKTTQHHGKMALTRGLGTTILRETFFTNIYFILLKKIREIMDKKIHNPVLAQISSGLLSGCVVAATTQPCMVITAKLYADMEKKQYHNGFDATYKTFVQEGIRGFYKGGGYRSIGVILALPVFDYVQKTLKGSY